MMLDFDRAVIAFSSQPFWLNWVSGSGPRRHAPDFFARLADGGGVVLDVRPDDQVDAAAAETFAVTALACADVGWELRRTGGPPTVLAANVRWLAGYRHPGCRRPDIAEDLSRVFSQPMPWRAIVPVRLGLAWSACR
jgi:hypothetical protein